MREREKERETGRKKLSFDDFMNEQNNDFGEFLRVSGQNGFVNVLHAGVRGLNPINKSNN